MANEPLEVLVANVPDVAEEPYVPQEDIEIPNNPTFQIHYVDRQEERQAGRYTVITTKRYIVSAPPKGTK